MQITRTPLDGVLQLNVAGRLDSYWADHLDVALAQAIRDDQHHLRIDLSAVSFLSSAGIAVLMKFHKQVDRIGGSLAVVSPSAPVRAVLDMVRLTAVLVAPLDAPGPVPHRAAVDRQVEHEGVPFAVRELARDGSLCCRVIGGDIPAERRSHATEAISLGSSSALFALGVGAFGTGIDDCRARFGELLSIAGATAYQPADGTNVPDYLVSDGTLADDVRVLYCLACEGSFTHVARFERTIGLKAMTEACLEIAGCDAAGFVLIGETSGLVGASLRRSPLITEDLFAFPAIRHHLTFTAERAFLRSLTLAAGVVARGHSARELPQLRPLGGDHLRGHVHAAAFPFRPLKKGEIDLTETVKLLFEHEPLLGVLHLLHDDRGAAGAGESEFIRGVCWVGPIVKWLSDSTG